MQDARHLHAQILCEDSVGLGVLILRHPSTEFVLEDAAAIDRRKSTQPLCSVFTGGKTPQAALLILLGSSDVNQIGATFLATWHRIARLFWTERLGFAI